MRQEQHYQEQAVKAGLLAKRQASARARRYYNEYELQLKAKLQKRRIREEQVVFPPLSSPSFLPPPFLFSSPSPFLFLLPLVQLFTQATSLKIPSLASTDSPFLRIKLSSSFFFCVSVFQIFRRAFEDGLDIQRERARELQRYAKEQQQSLAKRHREQLESMEN